jgi:hypothetical protein
MKKSSIKSDQKITNFVKRRMWNYNVRATTRAMIEGCILMADRWNVFCTSDPTDERPYWADYTALVTDYGDHKSIRFFDKKGHQQKALLYHLGNS